MKVKLTPLNIVSAACLVAGLFVMFSEKKVVQHKATDLSGLFGAFLLLSAVIAFVSDLIFRRFIPSLAKIWVVEGVLVIFTIILILL